MHDIDRALFEMEQGESGGDREGPLQETYELEMAAELLEVTNEAELDRFLGGVIQKAVGGRRSSSGADVGDAVGGLLKGVARHALPRLGRAVGEDIAPGVGGNIGAKLGRFVGGQLGLELEGLSQEDRELEAARAFANFANETASIAVAAPPNVPPTVAATKAAAGAARTHLPELVPVIKALSPPGQSQQARRDRPQSGQWERWGTEGRHLLVRNVFPPVPTRSRGVPQCLAFKPGPGMAPVRLPCGNGS